MTFDMGVTILSNSRQENNVDAKYSESVLTKHDNDSAYNPEFFRGDTLMFGAHFGIPGAISKVDHNSFNKLESPAVIIDTGDGLLAQLLTLPL